MVFLLHTGVRSIYYPLLYIVCFMFSLWSRALVRMCKCVVASKCVCVCACVCARVCVYVLGCRQLLPDDGDRLEEVIYRFSDMLYPFVKTVACERILCVVAV